MSEVTFKEYQYWPHEDRKPESLVIMIHGLGADGRDLISLSEYFAQGLPNTAFVAPDAPFPCDMAPMGYQWFSLQNRDPHIMLEGVQGTAPILNSYISTKIEEFGLPDNQVALLGFSQGTMMSLYVAPRRATQLGAVLGYSGAMIGPELLAEELNTKPPVHLIHGTADDVVPFDVMQPSAEIFKGLGFDIDTTTCEGTGHNIDELGLTEGIKFLSKHLK